MAIEPNESRTSNGHFKSDAPAHRPTIRTEENAARICELISKGVPARWAAQEAGVSSSAFFEWQAADADFAERVKQARAGKIKKLVGRIWDDAQTSWVAAMTLLERTEPEDFGRTNKVRHSHEGTVNLDVRPMMASPKSIDLIASLEQSYEVDGDEVDEVDGDPLRLPPHQDPL
jgi:hypothetical protein